jgi:hypothetical protein
MVDRVQDEFYAIGNSQLVEDAEKILLDRMLAQTEFARDIAIAEPFGDESDGLLLPGSE